MFKGRKQKVKEVKQERKQERSYDKPMLHSDGVHIWKPFIAENGQKLYRLV